LATPCIIDSGESIFNNLNLLEFESNIEKVTAIVQGTCTKPIYISKLKNPSYRYVSLNWSIILMIIASSAENNRDYNGNRRFFAKFFLHKIIVYLLCRQPFNNGIYCMFGSLGCTGNGKQWEYTRDFFSHIELSTE
jgi:hypothetical protein